MLCLIHVIMPAPPGGIFQPYRLVRCRDGHSLKSHQRCSPGEEVFYPERGEAKSEDGCERFEQYTYHQLPQVSKSTRIAKPLVGMLRPYTAPRSSTRRAIFYGYCCLSRSRQLLIDAISSVNSFEIGVGGRAAVGARRSRINRGS